MMHDREKSDPAIVCAGQRLNSGGLKSLQRSDEGRCIQRQG